MNIEEKCVEDVEIKSPIVGTFYDGSTPSPVIPASQSDTRKPYVELGSHVEPDTVVCIVGAMMVPVPIKAKINGTIKERLVNSGQAVKYQQPLFKITPDNNK